MEETQEIKRPRLLLADDSITIRKVVEMTFAEEGIDVFAVADGEAAMKKFVEVQPDIVLVDVNMPDPDGYHICEMIKQDESTSAIPVMLLVGSFEPFDTAEAERVGADGFMTKPFQSVRELIAKVCELLGNEEDIAPPAVETSDIENLFTSSFAETYRAPDGSTTDTFLGDTGMDDDLIEASPQNGPEPEAVLSGEAGSEDTVEGYDWMAERAEESSSEEISEEETSPEESSVEKSFADETFAHEAPAEEAPSEQASAEETFIEEASEPTPANGGFSRTAADEDLRFERVVDDLEDTIEVEEFDTAAAAAEDVGPTGRAEAPYEPSEEFINIIARRVVEKLSDRAVREIARETVPRITEKLIREALDQDKK